MTPHIAQGIIAEHHGLPGLDLDAYGVGRLRMHDGCTLDIQLLAPEGMLRLATLVGTISHTGLHGIMLGALTTNLSMSAAGKPHLAMDADRRLLYVCKTLDLEALEPDTLLEALKNVSELRRQYQEKIREAECL